MTGLFPSSGLLKKTVLAPKDMNYIHHELIGILLRESLEFLTVKLSFFYSVGDPSAQGAVGVPGGEGHRGREAEEGPPAQDGPQTPGDGQEGCGGEN